MRKKKILLSAGGTGGHLFPAQALASTLCEQCEILFVGGGLSSTPFFDRASYEFREIHSATFSLSKPLEVLRRMPPLVRGINQARAILSEFAPDAVVGFGSYYTLPVLVAAQMKRVPLFLHEQNALPGKVNRLFSRFAKGTGITFPESADHLKGKCAQVRFPMRAEGRLHEDPWAYFGLKEGPTTLLVFGGSQGGRGLNALFLEAAERLPVHFQILHFTGTGEAAALARALYRARGIAHVVKEFEERMDLAWRVADLAVCRAGAATIWELVASETPALLIPFPYASENHQERNGAFFVECVGGGRMLVEHKATGAEVGALIEQLLSALSEHRLKISSYRTAYPSKSFAEWILESL